MKINLVSIIADEVAAPAAFAATASADQVNGGETPTMTGAYKFSTAANLDFDG